MEAREIGAMVRMAQSCLRVGWTRGSGWVTISPDFPGSGRVSTSCIS